MELKIFLTIFTLIQIFYQGSTLPLSENSDNEKIVSVVTSKSIVENQAKITKATDEEQKIKAHQESDKNELKNAKIEVTTIQAHPVNVHDATKAYTDVSKSTKKEESSSTVKTHTDEEDEDDDEDYGNPDTDDGLKATCIAALCGIGK